MKLIMHYQCDYCDFTDSDKLAVQKHEASHFNLDVDTYVKWQILKQQVQQYGHAVYTTKNAKTDQAFDDAIQALMDFENEHDMPHT